MELNTDSWHAQLYKSTFVGLPDTLCEYFWKLVLLLVMLPFTWVALSWREVRIERSIGLNFVLTSLLYGLLGICLLLGWEMNDDYGFIDLSNNWRYVVLFFLGLGSLILPGVIIVGIGYALYYIITGIRDGIGNYIDNKRFNKSNKKRKQYIIVEWWKGFKNKYCPRIEWINEWK